MIDLMMECQRLLNGAQIVTTPVDIMQGRALTFEGMTVLGFIFAYDEPAHLLAQWSADSKKLIAANQLSLRRAEAKAWNTYTIFLASAAADYGQLVSLSAIEEDLTGTRKIARAGIGDAEQLRAAVLPLLPIQNAPQLEAVDMSFEIKLRTTELPSRVVEAFLSSVQEASAMQVLEEEP